MLGHRLNNRRLLSTVASRATSSYFVRKPPTASQGTPQSLESHSPGCCHQWNHAAHLSGLHRTTQHGPVHRRHSHLSLPTNCIMQLLNVARTNGKVQSLRRRVGVIVPTARRGNAGPNEPGGERKPVVYATRHRGCRLDRPSASYRMGPPRSCSPTVVDTKWTLRL